MAKATLLEIVQDILSDADSDEVNSISDTIESLQCANIVKDTFLNIVDQYDLSHHEEVAQLTATSSSTPTVMERPAGLHSIEWVKYNKKETAGGDPKYDYVTYMEPSYFLEMTNRRTESADNVQVMVLESSHELLILNDRAPEYYTFLQGYESFIFDSFDSDIEVNLQTSKSLVYGIVRPTLSLTDAAEPDLPEHLMTVLRNDARAFFFDVFKDGVTREIDKRARRADVRAQRMRYLTKDVRPEHTTGVNYGRKGR